MPMTTPLDRLKRTPKRRLALWGLVGYGLLLGAAALIGADITLRSKTRWVKGTFAVVGRRGRNVYLPASPETLSRGVIGLVPIRPNRGHAVLGEGKVAGTLVRREILEERGLIPNGSVAWVSSFVYNGTPEQLGIPFEHTSVTSPAGEMPAWHIPPTGPDKDALVIVVHGHGGQRAQGLRSLRALQRSGAGSLYVTFRNAHGAPRSANGYLTLGDEEAEDVLAALRWGQANGYRRAVLYGFSMGGNIVLSVLRARFRPFPLPVLGVILDSPALDWRDTIEWQGRRFGLPAFMARHVGTFVQYLVTRRSGQNFDAVDQLSAARYFDLPILLWHGTRDRTIPLAQAEALAAARPDLVEYHRVEGAKHIRCWNLDPGRYEAQLESFLGRVLHPGEGPA